MKKLLAQGITAGLLAGLAGMIYYTIYQNTLLTNFGSVVNFGSILGSSMFGCILITAGYWILYRLKLERYTGWFNVFISILSFASIIGPMSMSLPLDVESPELFPGLVVPLHFFPALAFFTIQPLFNRKEEKELVLS